MRAVLVVFIALFLAGGCSLKSRSVTEAGPAQGVFLEGVPFYPQDEYLCGPAALSSVFAYHGAPVGMAEAARRVYDERLKGTLPLDMLSYAKERGFEARYYRGGFSDLEESLRRGEPLILFLNLGYSFYPVGHYVVAVGMEEGGRAVFAHSGMDRAKAMSRSELESAWSKTGYSTLLIRPKGGLDEKAR